MAQVAVAWSLSKDFITAPIVGATSLHNLQDLIGQYKFSDIDSLSNLDALYSWCSC